MQIARALSLCLLAVAACGGCAGPQNNSHLDTARANFAALAGRPAQMMVSFDLATTRKLDSVEKKKLEARAISAFNPACVKPYTEKLAANVQTAAAQAKSSGSLSSLNSLSDYARALDKEFDACMRQFGVTGFNYVEREDAGEQRIPEYIDELLAGLRAYGAAHTEAAADQEENATLVLAAVSAALAARAPVNPNQTYVASYSRRDGTRVRGHLRTLPNETCRDNIRGCR